MKLVFEQDQETKGLISKSVQFLLTARVELTAEEATNVKKYKMGGEIIYSDERTQLGAAQMQVDGRRAAGVWNAMTGLSITVDDMIRGKAIQCNEIMEMLHVKETVTESCAGMKAMLDAAANFGGEEIIEL